jgi:hypothetical protein
MICGDKGSSFPSDRSSSGVGRNQWPACTSKSIYVVIGWTSDAQWQQRSAGSLGSPVVAWALLR